MKGWTARLLDLDTLRFGQEGVRFGFERGLEPWAWALAALGAAVFAWWTYRRLLGPLWARGALAGVRAALLLTIAALLAGPRLVQQTESVERDWVIVLVDRSASMGVEDAPAGAGRESREAQLRRALGSSWEMWRGLSAEREVVWLGFDAGAYGLSVGDGGVELSEPGGRRTALGLAMEQALRRAAARPLSGVVVFTDGRSMDEVSRATLRQLQSERAPVHVVALGSERPLTDLAIRRADGPGVAFVNDTAPVTVELERVGGEEGSAPVGATVRLTDTATGLTLAERRVEVGAEPATVTLIDRPRDAKTATWRVEVVPEGEDLIAGNNSAEVTVELIEKPLRVLYIDGYPRWEHRYVKNLLLREASVVSSNLILAPDRRYIQESDEDIAGLPDSPEGWAEFDAIMLGDVDPAVFTDAQLRQIRDHVATRGAGLLWIAGQGAVPQLWAGTPLGDLLPVTLDAGPIQAFGEPVVMRPEAGAERLGVLRLGESAEDPWPAALSDADAGWALLRWAQRIEPESLKPAVETLASASPATGSAESTPLVLSMRFGAGRVLYVGTDETWRWRYARGEELPERFWLQMVRLLGRESLGRTGRSGTLAVTPRRAVVDQPVRVDLELADQSLVDAGYGSVAVRLERAASAGEEQRAVELTLRPEGGAAGAAGSRRFAATWLPTEPGEWEARVVESGLAGLGLSAGAVVSLPDDELRRPETDHGALARLASETGGRVFGVEELGELPAALPNRQVRLVQETSETLWDTPLALLLVVGLLTVEWVGRRVIRLI